MAIPTASWRGFWSSVGAIALITGAVGAASDAAQQPREPPPAPPRELPKSAAPVERLGPTSLRVGNIQIDTEKKELWVRGTINEVTVLEFLACTKGGFKGYESAVELETNALNFNLALILIGLDSSRAVPPKVRFDPELPKGDPVEIFVEWLDGDQNRRVRGEQLVYNLETKQTLSEGPWVYTGSYFSPDSNQYMAEVDGSLIGFIHSPAPVIEFPRALAPGIYGANRLNPQLNLKPGQPVRLFVRALPRTQ
jgi:hypothetical protein